MKTFISSLSGKELPESEKISGHFIPPALLNLIKQRKPDFCEEDEIAKSELDIFKSQYIAEFLMKETGDLGELEKTVLDSLRNNSLISNDDVDDGSKNSSFGDRIADKVANFGGSWTFIISFCIVLVVWIGANALLFHNKGFDPYPFILLNLLLSCIAALQAPVIMMSQNRQEGKDRLRAKKDYMVNLKSELEIRMLHEKIDHLIMRQQEDLITMQREQIEQLAALVSKLNK